MTDKCWHRTGPVTFCGRPAEHSIHHIQPHTFRFHPFQAKPDAEQAKRFVTEAHGDDKAKINDEAGLRCHADGCVQVRAMLAMVVKELDEAWHVHPPQCDCDEGSGHPPALDMARALLSAAPTVSPVTVSRTDAE